VAELYRHTDLDGDRLSIVETVEIGSQQLITVKIGDEKGWSSAVYLDHAAALRLAAALQEHFNGQGASGD